MRALPPILILLVAAATPLVRAQDRPAAATGREVYAREACWQCHVQERDKAFPALTAESHRVGPVLGATRMPRSREWQTAHFFLPRSLEAESQMPAYPQYFEAHPNAAAVRAFVAKYDTHDGSLHEDGIVTRAEYGRSGANRWGAELEALDATKDDVISLADARPRPTRELAALLDYLDGLQAKTPPPVAAPREPAPKDKAASIARGHRLFRQHCAGCHGERADGNGKAAPFFAGHPPRNFLRGEYKFRSTVTPSPPLDTDLFRTIRGGAGPSMPAWPQLADRQVWDLVEYVKSNHPGYLPRELFVLGDKVYGDRRDIVLAFVREDAEVDDASGAALGNGRIQKRDGQWWWIRGSKRERIVDGKAVETGGKTYRFELGKPVYGWMRDYEPERYALPKRAVAYSRASAAEGAKVYAEFGCAACHGDTGKGDGPAVLQLRGSLGQIVYPADYTRGALWLKGGADDESLVRAFMTGLHGTPMPAYLNNFASARSAPPEMAPWHLAHFVMGQAGVPFPR